MRTNTTEIVDIRFLPAALLVWVMLTLILLPITAGAACICSLSERTLLYFSAAISFLSALGAGSRAIMIRKKNAVLTAMIISLCLILLALTTGFLVAGERMDAGSVLSVSSFTMAGAFTGCVLFRGQSETYRKNRKGRSARKHP